MSNYTKSTNFATKDNLTPGDPLKVVRGTEIDTEYNDIATAIATKTDGAASSTDNAIARFDSTTGKIIQNSVVTIADTTGDIVGTATQAVFNTVSTTVNAFGAATTVNLGAATGTATVNNTTLAAKAITASTTLAVTGAATLSSTLAVTGTSTLTGAVTATAGVTGPITSSSVSITGGSITGITDLAVADGGTGASTANNALNNLLPSQTGNANKYLQTDGTNSTWDAVSLSTADITGTLGVANGGTGVTTSTGTTNVVLSNSPTLVTPILGTPTSATLTNATGLPISTGVSGLGTGVATFLATPSSANLRSALTDETGTGSAVFATSPTLVTPVLGVATGTSFQGIIGNVTPAAGSFTTVDASGAVTLSGGTANGVTYLNGSKVLTSGSALTFDGTNFAVVGGNATINRSTNTSRLTLGGSPSGNWEGDIQFVTSNTQTNWRVSSNQLISGAFTITPSTAGGGSTFTSPAVLIDSSSNVGIGTTSPATRLEVAAASPIVRITDTTSAVAGGTYGALEWKTSDVSAPSGGIVGKIDVYDDVGIYGDRGAMRFYTNDSASIGERARITSAGNLLVGTTNTNPGGADINGIALRPGNFSVISALGTTPFGINRGTDDGILINFSQAGSTEGSISVSGTTVSYNGGHLSRWAQTTTAKDDSLLKGTVLSNLDEMNVYTKDGQPVDNEQLNKVKVSDVEGDVNVAGVFVNWSHDEDHNVDEINMAMTGDMIIRIAQGVTVVRGDLLMSAGDGTAKPQGDDIIRSKTVAKVTSNHVTCTYADGSYCVPCVLMAC